MSRNAMDGEDADIVPADFARQLERELAEARLLQALGVPA